MSSKALVALAALALLALPQAASGGAPAPAGFIGISPQDHSRERDYRLMEGAGVRTVRLPLYWTQVESIRPFLAERDWDAFDTGVKLAARHEMRVLPVVAGSPSWIAAEPRLEPVFAWQRRSWAAFLRAAVRRYGAGGSFWDEHPELPYSPVRLWELWNEQNIVTFGRANPELFARLLRTGGRAIHAADRHAKVILGGLFGRPLQIPPNVSSGEFLNRVYRARRVKQHFDGVALHPYVADAWAMRSQILNLRRVMRLHRDGATRLYVTELGWGSDSYETRWERGLRGQARELDQAFRMLSNNRRRWRIGGVWWFSLTDLDGACQFCDSAGLLTKARKPKPSWYRFNEWTGGDADVIDAVTAGEGEGEGGPPEAGPPVDPPAPAAPGLDGAPGE